MKPTGYIALHRAVFAHRLFKDDKPFSRFQAWVWLIAEAAWQKKANRTVGARVVAVQRGQLATTTRMLAEAWGWDHSKVRRFLAALEREEMVHVAAVRQADTLPDTLPDTLYAQSAKSVTVITICNYSKFNDLSTLSTIDPTRSPTRSPTQLDQQAFEFSGANRAEESNHLTTNNSEGIGGGKGKKGSASKPAHGTKSRANGTIWIDKDSAEWAMYAADYETVTGALPLPKVYREGSGYWFFENGEGARRRRTA